MKTLKRRKREYKTDYKKRLNILKSRIPRVVFRRTNRYVIAQYISSEQTKDKIEIGISSKSLLKYGWPKELSGSLKSLGACYLTGFLMGKTILKEKKEAPILDLGMQRIIYKSRIFAFLKGLVDSGIKIKYDEKTFPDEEMISGKKLKKDLSKTFSEVKTRIENG